MTTEFQLNVLGPPELVRGGRAPVRFRTKKHLAVLLYLHLEGRTRAVPRERLVDLLWPDAPPSKGRHSLSQALFAIRARLGNGAVTGKEKESVQLLADLPSDVSVLGRARADGVRIAEPLQGLEDCGGIDFAHWVDGARARLRTEAREGLRSALHGARAKGDAALTHLVAAALHDIDPLCAEAVFALAERALLERDTVTAVRVLKDYLARARAELGTNPSPEIIRLLRRVERGERAVPPAPEPTGHHPFVARGTELGRLEAIANRVVDARAYQACLITGTPGIGKSSLIRRFATSLEARAWPIFMVSCQEIGQGIPYAAVSELMTAVGRDSAAGGTDPLWLAEASRVSPGLRAIYPGVGEPPAAPAESIRLRVAEALLRMLDAVSDGGPVLLAIDDLQFLDPASHEVLFLVGHRLAGGGVPVLMVAGARPGEPSPGGLAWTETIDLTPLDHSHANTLIRDLSVDMREPGKEISDSIVRLAQGNPYHIELLLSDWRAHQENSLVAAESLGDGVALSWAPPPDLRAAFARQYGGLSTDTQHALEVLAVAGKAMLPAEIRSLLALDEGATERVVLEMLDRGVGRVTEGRLSFKNELHRAYVYHAIGAERRAYHHTQFAERLAAATQQVPTMLELVHHSIGAGLQQQAMETGLVAAEVAIAQGAPREAERLLTWLLRAYTVPPTSRLRLLLAHALVAAAQYQRALDALRDWRSDDASATDRALAALIRADALERARLADNETIVRAAEDAVALAQEANAASLLVRANYLRMEVALDCGDIGAVQAADAVAETIAATGTSPECVAIANLTLGQGALPRGEYDRAVERLTAAVPVLESLGMLLEVRRVLNTLGIAYRGLGDFAQAAAVFRKHVAVSEQTGHRGAIVQSRLLLCNVYHDLGFFAAAVDWCRKVIDPLAVLASPRADAEAYSNITRLALVLGNIAEAEVAVERCEDGARRSALPRHRVTALCTRADIHLASGRAELAWPLVEEAARLIGERAHLLPDAGPYVRLQHHFLWATRGYDALQSLVRPAKVSMFDSVVDSLEVRLLDEAIALRSGDATGAPVLAEAAAAGLFGPLARVLAFGPDHPMLHRSPGESAAHLIARVYPHPERAVTPQSLGLVR